MFCKRNIETLSLMCNIPFRGYALKLQIHVFFKHILYKRNNKPFIKIH